MELLEYDWTTYTEDEMIIVYGTAAFGEMVHYGLKHKNIVPTYYVNQEGQGFFHGVPVIGIDMLAKLYKEVQPTILLAVGASSEEVILKLEKAKINRIYSVENLLDEALDRNEIWGDAYKYRRFYFYKQESFANADKLFLLNLDVVVTERCSLRCRKCSNLMQYYHAPKNFDVYQIKNSLDKVLNIVDGIYELIILGGETFMNPDFHLLLDWYIDNPKIKAIVVLANATIFPKEDVLKKMTHRKIVIRISDYGELSRSLDKWAVWCESNHVEYEIVRMDKWQDCGNLEKHNYSASEIRYVYETCECKDTPTLLEGKLYNCPYAANAANLGAMYEDEAVRDQFELDDRADIKERLREFLFDRKYLAACDYCEGRNFKRSSIKPFEQAEEPLDYVIRRENENALSECDNSNI